MENFEELLNKFYSKEELKMLELEIDSHSSDFVFDVLNLLNNSESIKKEKAKEIIETFAFIFSANEKLNKYKVKK